MSEVGNSCDLVNIENNDDTEDFAEKLDMVKLEGVDKVKASNERYLKFDEEIGCGSFKTVFKGCYSTGRLDNRFQRPSTATAWPGYQTGDFVIAAWSELQGLSSPRRSAGGSMRWPRS